MKAVIMAGGFGTRIRPLTFSIPKPMLPVVNIPIMEHMIDLLKREGFTDLYVLLFFQPDVIKDYFGDGSDFGVRIKYLLPDRDYGTAGAVGLLRNVIKERFLVISADLITNYPLGDLWNYHISKSSFVTIGLVSVENPLQFGVVITDKDGRVVKFLEKPSWGEVFSDTVNTGIYVLEPEVFDHIPYEEEYDFSKDLFPSLLNQGYPIFGYNTNCYWKDVGSPESYMGVHMDVFNEKISLRIDGTRVKKENATIYIGENTEVADNVAFEGLVVLGNGVKVGNNVFLRNVVIGDNTIVSIGSKVFESIIWHNVNIGNNVEINESVICNDTVIDSETMVEKNTVIAEGVRIGSGVHIKSGVKIWPLKIVEDNAIVTDNLIWAERWKSSIFESGKVTGLTNMELTPEFVAKLGVAYGSYLKEGSYILVGRDSYPGSRMLARAFIGGVLSTGVNVRDLHAVCEPVLRFKLEGFGEIGGVYFRRNPSSIKETDIMFFDSKSLTLSSGQEKSIERILFKEEFRRVDVERQGLIEELGKIKDFYAEGYLRSLNVDAIRSKNYKIVVDYNFGPSSLIFPEIMGKLGVRIIGINAGDPVGVWEEDWGDLRRIVISIGADVGFSLSQDGEYALVIDDAGNFLSTEEVVSVVSLLLSKVGKKGKVALSVTIPEYIERFLVLEGFDVKRIPVTRRKIEEEALRSNYIFIADSKGRFIFPEFHRTFDGLFFIGFLLELLSYAGMKVSEALRSSPKGFFKKLKYYCPQSKKGSIMRKLVEFYADRELVLIDGVKVKFEDGYFLVVHDEESPDVVVYCEASCVSSLERLEREIAERMGLLLS
jgi:mannose-1-phosphate guanylyltransferase/phosphomannomutase